MLNINNIFSTGHLYRAGQSMNTPPSQILERLPHAKRYFFNNKGYSISAVHSIAKGFEFCDIEENIREAEILFRENEQKRILFYCDDFLGSNMYDTINNKGDSHIVNLPFFYKSPKPTHRNN